MKKTIIWFVIAFFIVLVVGIIFGNSMIINKLETKEYKINDNFKDIKIITDIADIEIVTSEKSDSLIVCDEQKNVNHLVKAKDNVLLIEIDNNRKWYEQIGINFSTPKITIYLPKNEYGKLSIKNSTGNIHIENINVNIIDLTTSTGNTNIVDANCQKLLSKGSTGNISLENVIATEKFSIERSTGNIKFKDCDASDIFVKTDTGNVTGSLLTDKVFFTETDTGKVDVPKIIADEKCEIITDTGDIKITID